MTTGIATIAVAGVGFAMLTGRIDIRRGTVVVLGCFLLFSAPMLARTFMQWTTGSDGVADRYAVVAPPLPPPPQGPAQAQPFDPYAGASLIR